MGGCKCTFRKCNVSTKKFPNMSFFHYPVTKQERFDKWVQHAKYSIIKTMPFSQAKNRSVCGLHFKDECFMNYKRNKLTPTAVPSLDRLKNGKVLDYSLAEHPKPTTIPPTKDEHLVPPEGALIWGQLPEFWKTYSTVAIQYIARPKPIGDVNDYTHEPSAKKPKIMNEVSETPRILNKGICLISNVSLDENFELENTTTISLNNDDVFPQDDEIENNPVVDDSTCNIEASNCQETNPTDSVCNGDSVIDLDDVDFLNVDPMDTVEETVSKSTLEATCNAYDEAISVLRKEKQTQEMEAEKEIAELRAALEQSKTKLHLSGNMAAAWKFKITEYEKRVTELAAKNLELLNERGAMQLQLAAIPKAAATSSTSVSLTKPQLFNGIKKYLSASMTALVRMEMFGSSERPWKPDEKQVSVELMKLGEDVYKYFRDEWRFRLPPKKMVEEWTNEVADEDVEDL